MRLFHGRWRERVSLLAAGALGPAEETAVRAHLDACPSCRADCARSSEALALLARDPVRTAEVPVPVAHLVRRVQARLDAAPEAAPFRWAPVWTATAALASAAIVFTVVPRLAERPSPAPAATSAEASDADVPDEVVARMERRLSRDQAARYLDEAQDVLVTVAGHPADCERDHERVDVGEEARRSRELLARRALMVELGGDEVASARPLLDDVEGLLREVAALPACARADSLDAIHRQMQRRNVLMKIDLLTNELRG
ncbi:MAG: zf-HC2 domain-containing protein [Vicinamibacteria bacterium]